MSASTMQQAGILTGRQLVMGVVIGLHAVVIGGLMAMRIDMPAKPLPQAFKPITPVTEKKPEEALRPRLVVDAPGPVIVVLPPVPQPIISRNEPAPGPIAREPPAEPVGGIVATTPVTQPFTIAPTALLERAIRSPDDYYPTVSRQLQEEGVSTVQVCVGPTGRLEGRPTVVRGSGSRHLDNAAIKWAGEALAFTPATRNGSPVSACKEYRVRFTLR